jgi:hypothetical protein
MSTLVVHPIDPTTDFLKPIYASIQDKTVVNGVVSKTDLINLIEIHHRVIMLGHGSPDGLMSVGQFPDDDFHIVDDSLVELLRNKTDNLYIWCHADQFVQRHGLDGFFTGMFISEVDEAIYYGFGDVDWDVIQESNDRFSSIVGKYIDEPLEVLFDYLICDYGILARNNIVAHFNIVRLGYSTVKSFVEI